MICTASYRFRLNFAVGFVILILLISLRFFTLSATDRTGNEKELTTFGRIYQEIANVDDGKKNQVWSPFGLKMALAMLYAGAEGKAETEIRNTLKWTGKVDGEVFHDFKNKIKSISEGATKWINVTLATRVFADYKEGNISENRRKQLLEGLGVGVEGVKFGDVAGAARRINEWVKEQTEGRIETILNGDDIQREVACRRGSLIVTNAVYFKAEWAASFHRGSSALFRGNSKHNQVFAHFLRAKAYFNYGNIQELRAEVVRIPYKGGRFSMIALLPHERSNLEFLEMIIAQGFPLKSLPSRLKGKEMVLHFPEFEIGTTIAFREILENMGITRNFDKDTQDRWISRYNCVTVDAIFQKTIIQVKMEGDDHSPFVFPRNKATSMRFNRPFIAYILDEFTDTILLILRKVK